LLLNDHVETLKSDLDKKIADSLKVVEYLKSQENVDPWELGMKEGQLLTFEFCRGRLEMDETVRKEMFENTMDRLIAAR
jgi:hypothetical protein